MRKTSRTVAGLCLALLSAAAQAAAIGSGLFGTRPHILGIVAPGDLEEVQADLAGPLRSPLSIDIHPLSDPIEVARIALWLREHQPPLTLTLKGSCVGSCARSLLLAGQVQTIQPGTVIAFGGVTGVLATLKDQIDAGKFFTDDDERGRQSREAFLKSFDKSIQRSQTLRDLTTQQAPLPPMAQSFIDRLLGGWRVDRLSFIDDEAKYSVATGQHRCMWWVPDAEGLRQLGLDVPGYQPVDRAVAAELLKLPESFVYVGPALDTLPEQPLCKGQKGFTFPPRP